MKPRFSTQRLILSLLIILSLYSPSLHARRVYLFISKDDFNDAASSSPEHEPAVFDDPMRIPDPGSWSPLFDPDMNPEAVNGSYYAAVSELMSAASKGNARMMAGAAAEIESAANDGDPHAQSVLAFLYGAGIMRERNEAKALMYHHFATQGGSFQSKMALAYTYYRQGMYEKAAKLYAEIAKTGVKSFLTSKDSPVVEPIMIHDGAEEDKEVLMNFHGEEDESFKMLVKEAEEGNAGAMYRIGMIHLLGLRGLRVDHAKALSWLSKAADKGEPESMYLLGEMYATGVVCVERNYTKALELLTLASEQHLYAAYDRMGYLYLNGYGVDKDYTKAIEYFQKAAENDGAGGHYNLGLMYLKGTGVKRNVQLAIKYFLIAANSGYDLAFYQLAKRFHTGVGLKRISLWLLNYTS
ncbi:hypothetical protein Dsin_033105 [Dipteronia sinensis]|uniref:Uncharacterized protein n=1 Tax=Dipteronia sinensis TaxID=43782 RepID=A0AAD9Z6W2_9ROSI|nr:hypothetical protein Dsin_033105 [Dipteronia sinensis]